MCPSREGHFCHFTTQTFHNPNPLNLLKPEFTFKNLTHYTNYKHSQEFKTLVVQNLQSLTLHLYGQNFNSELLNLSLSYIGLDMVLKLWYVRNAREEYDANDLYGQNPELFSLKIYHGGRFTRLPDRKYVNEQVNFVDMVDKDEFSVHEVGAMMVEIGYGSDDIMYYHFKVPNQDLNFGLRALGNDTDVINFLQYVSNFKLMEVYIEHNTTTVETYFLSPSRSNVRIEEIIDPGPSRPFRSSQEITNFPRRNIALEWNVPGVHESNRATFVVNEGNEVNVDVGVIHDTNEYFRMINEGIEVVRDEMSDPGPSAKHFRDVTVDEVTNSESEDDESEDKANDDDESDSDFIVDKENLINEIL